MILLTSSDILTLIQKSNNTDSEKADFAEKVNSTYDTEGVAVEGGLMLVLDNTEHIVLKGLNTNDLLKKYSTMSLDQKIRSILIAFEMGRKEPRYDAIYVFPDGRNRRRQVTLSYGYTEDSGSLYKLLQFYTIADGQFADQLLPYLPKIGTGKLHNSDSFKSLLIEAAQKDAFFCECQDFAFKALYLNRGYTKAAEYGIKTNLGIAVIVDSVLHGSLDVVSNLFREARPSRGGNEKEFIKAYCDAREKWLKSKGEPLSNTTYRPQAFKKAIELGDWDLSQNFNANGIII